MKVIIYYNILLTMIINFPSLFIIQNNIFIIINMQPIPHTTYQNTSQKRKKSKNWKIPIYGPLKSNLSRKSKNMLYLPKCSSLKYISISEDRRHPGTPYNHIR